MLRDRQMFPVLKSNDNIATPDYEASRNMASVRIVETRGSSTVSKRLHEVEFQA